MKRRWLSSLETLNRPLEPGFRGVVERYDELIAMWERTYRRLRRLILFEYLFLLWVAGNLVWNLYAPVPQRTLWGWLYKPGFFVGMYGAMFLLYIVWTLPVALRSQFHILRHIEMNRAWRETAQRDSEMQCQLISEWNKVHQNGSHGVGGTSGAQTPLQ